MTASAQAPGDNLRLAVSAIIFTVFALSLGDAVIKQISAAFPLWQVFVVRSVIAIAVLVVTLKTWWRTLPLRPQVLGWTALRSLMLTAMWIAYYTALPHVAISAAAAVYYTLPLFITLFAGLLLGEKIGVRGWGAVVLGFCGVLLILRPDAAAFNAYALLPLLSAILYALAMILTRSKCKDEHPLVLSLALNVSFILTGCLATLVLWVWSPSEAVIENDRFLLGPWVAMGLQEWLTMGLLATAVLVGSIGAAIAYQTAPASIVGTFDFSYLAFAALWGFLFFAEVPEVMTIGGIVLIATAGIATVRRP